jgi:hypothetical protein
LAIACGLLGDKSRIVHARSAVLVGDEVWSALHSVIAAQSPDHYVAAAGWECSGRRFVVGQDDEMPFVRELTNDDYVQYGVTSRTGFAKLLQAKRERLSSCKRIVVTFGRVGGQGVDHFTLTVGDDGRIKAVSEVTIVTGG